MRRLFFSLILISILLVMPIHALAHPGRTDSSGGHRNRSTGEYHYHHGYPEHDHVDLDGDGKKDCPYTFEDNTDHSSNSESRDLAQNRENPDRNSLKAVTSNPINYLFDNLFEIFIALGLGMLVLSTFILPFTSDSFGYYYIKTAFSFIGLSIIAAIITFFASLF